MGKIEKVSREMKRIRSAGTALKKDLTGGEPCSNNDISVGHVKPVVAARCG